MGVSVRGQTINLAVKLITEECCNCGVVFAMTEELRQRRLDDHGSFFCPNGHSQHYTGKSDAEKLREQLAKSERDRVWYEQRTQQAIEDEAAARRSLSATRGQVTKLRKRAVAGTCPFGCRRHFVNLERHVATKHEGSTLPGESATAG